MNTKMGKNWNKRHNFVQEQSVIIIVVVVVVVVVVIIVIRSLDKLQEIRSFRTHGNI